MLLVGVDQQRRVERGDRGVLGGHGRAEGEVAGDYLEQFLDILDFDGDIDLDVEGDRAVVSIVGGDDLVDEADLQGLLGADEGVAGRLVALRDAALLWRSPEGLAPTRTVVDVLGPLLAGRAP